MTNSITLFVPKDTAAIAVGADAVAQAIAREAASRKLSVNIVRNGSRGLLWLQTLVAVATHAGRGASRPAEADHVHGVVGAGCRQGHPHHAGKGVAEKVANPQKQ